jgi:hypothetical protein
MITGTITLVQSLKPQPAILIYHEDHEGHEGRKRKSAGRHFSSSWFGHFPLTRQLSIVNVMPEGSLFHLPPYCLIAYCLLPTALLPHAFFSSSCPFV